MPWVPRLYTGKEKDNVAQVLQLWTGRACFVVGFIMCLCFRLSLFKKSIPDYPLPT